MVQIKRTELFFLVFFFILIIGCTPANGPSKIKESSKTPSQIQSSDVDISEISDNETGEISNQNADFVISDENQQIPTENQSENGAGEMSNQGQNQIVDDSTLDVSEQDDTPVTSEEETEISE